MAGRAYVFSKPKRLLPRDPARTAKAKTVGTLFVDVGRLHGDQYPWHHTADPFRILAAEYLLSRTARSVVETVYNDIFNVYPNAAALAGADPGNLAEITRPAGLPIKTAGLRDIANQVVEAGRVEPDRAWLLSLPFVGDYIADAVLLYAFKRRVIPLDRNFQRVIHRVFFAQEPPRRSIEPYRDPETVYVVEEMTEGLDIQGIRHFHQGVLVVAWDFCRYRPRITECPIKEHCLLAHQQRA